MNLRELKNKYNLTDLELFSQDVSTRKISFVANKLKQAETVHTSGVALRLLHNKKIGFAANYGTYNLEELTSQALDISKFSPDSDIELPGNLQKVESNNINTKNDLILQSKEKGKEIIEIILNEIQNVLVDISFDISSFTEKIKNTKDLDYSNSKAVYSFSINLRETLENDFIDIYTGASDNHLPDYKESINEVVKYYKLCKKHCKIKNGPCPILFTSKAAKDLLSTIEDALNGKNVIQKSSPWHDKLGKQVLSRLITLKQDPNFGYMARSVDDEGNTVKPLALIEDGILKNFYFDLISGCRAMPWHGSTGNGFKSSLSSQPEPSLLNMIVSSGTKSTDQIIKNIDYGLLVDQTMGGLTTNISGDMSVNVDLGFLIEKGELIGRVKDTMISGNIYNALNNIIELSNKPQWLWSNIYNPNMLLDGFTVTGR